MRFTNNEQLETQNRPVQRLKPIKVQSRLMRHRMAVVRVGSGMAIGGNAAAITAKNASPTMAVPAIEAFCAEDFGEWSA